MKAKLVIDPSLKESSVVIFTPEDNASIKRLLAIIEDFDHNDFLMVYQEGEIVRLSIKEIISAFTEKGVIWISTSKEKYRTKYRIYELEERLKQHNFVKINQGVIINLESIRRVSPCLNGTMEIELKNGSREFASRRSVKKIKERLLI